jgi:hypothetical protein
VHCFLLRLIFPLVAQVAVFLVGAAIFSAPARSQTAPTPAEIKAKIEDALKALPAVGLPADPLWRDQADALRSRISSFPADDGVAAAIERSVELEALLKKLSASTNPNLRDALDNLTNATAAIEANEPVSAFGKRLLRLESLVKTDKFPIANSEVVAGLGKLSDIVGRITGSDSVLKFKSGGDALVAQLQNDKLLKGNRSDVLATALALLPLLESLEEIDPAAAIIRRAKSNTDLVTRLVDKKPLKDSDAVRTALVELSSKITSAVTPLVPRIHILQARYGDLRKRPPNSRVCNAAASMSTQCERATNCLIPASTDLCGFDPMAQANEADKGLLVWYQCVTGSDQVWSRIAGIPGKQVAGLPVQFGTFRTSTQKLLCLAPERP